MGMDLGMVVEDLVMEGEKGVGGLGVVIRTSMGMDLGMVVVMVMVVVVVMRMDMVNGIVDMKRMEVVMVKKMEGKSNG